MSSVSISRDSSQIILSIYPTIFNINDLNLCPIPEDQPTVKAIEQMSVFGRHSISGRRFVNTLFKKLITADFAINASVGNTILRKRSELSFEMKASRIRTLTQSRVLNKEIVSLRVYFGDRGLV